MWNLISVYLEIVLVSVQDRCTVSAKHTIGLETILTKLMVHRVDEAQVEPRFGPFGYRTNLDTSLGHALRRTYRRLENHFGRTR
jgi:hypothetical protein